MIDATLISAFAALGGASIGGVMSFMGSWIVQKKEVRAQWLAQDRQRRRDLYKEFIQEASKFYVDAIEHDTLNVSSLVVLYEKISRMRIISSHKVISAADGVLRKLIDILFEPPVALTKDEVRTLIESGSADILRNFSESCRDEFVLPDHLL